MGMGLEDRNQGWRPRRAFLLAAVTALALLAMQAASSRVSAASALEADLAITKADSPDPVTAGTAITYTVQLVNAGPDPAAGVVVTDSLPRGTTFVSAQSSQGLCALSSNGRKVTCTLGTVAVMVGPQYNPTPVTITLVVNAPTGVGKGRTITNSASVDSDTKDPRKGNDKASASTRVVEPPVATCRGRAANVVGTPGPDLLVGTAGDDVILAGLGDDRIFSFGGDDLVCAGAGNDVTGSGGGADRVLAGRGADRAFGRGGRDTLRGGRGRDRLRGGSGADLLAGGLGRDRCFGGPGPDIFRSC
jgi:uncharacterized repeat protein (TIGR01451 family)